MAKLSEKALRKRDVARDIGAELLASVREMKAGRAGHAHRVPVAAITEARTRTGERSARLVGKAN
jgi:putative transcriptional regulator